MEVRQSWVYGDSPGEHFAGELRSVGTLFNWQDSTSRSQRAGSLLLNNEHCGFTVQNCTHISFTCRYLIPVPIANAVRKQALLVL